MLQPPKAKLRKDRGLRPFAVANALDMQRARENGKCEVCGYRGRALLFVRHKPGDMLPSGQVKTSRGSFLRALASCRMLCCNCETEQRLHLRRAPNKVVFLHSQGSALKQLISDPNFVPHGTELPELVSENYDFGRLVPKSDPDVEPVILKLDIPE